MSEFNTRSNIGAVALEEAETRVNTEVVETEEVATRSNVESETSTEKVTLPSKEEIAELNEVMINVNPVMNAALAVEKIFGLQASGDASRKNNAVANYIKDPEKFVRDDYAVRDKLKNDLMRGFMNDLAFGGLEDNADYAPMNGSLTEMAGSLSGMLVRDVALSKVTGIPMGFMMGIDSGIQHYNHLLAENPDEERAVAYAVAHGVAMSTGYGVGLKVMPKIVGLFMKSSFTETVAASFMKGGFEMIGWTGADKYANRALKNGIDMAYGDPELFSNVAALQKTPKYTDLQNQIDTQNSPELKEQMGVMYAEAFTKDLMRMRTEDNEEPVSAWTAASLFLAGGLMHATPKLTSKMISKAYAASMAPINAAADTILPNAMSTIEHFPSIKFKKNAVVEFDGTQIKEFVAEIKGMGDGVLEPRVAKWWYSLNSAYHNKKNYRQVMRVLNVRKAK